PNQRMGRLPSGMPRRRTGQSASPGPANLHKDGPVGIINGNPETVFIRISTRYSAQCDLGFAVYEAGDVLCGKCNEGLEKDWESIIVPGRGPRKYYERRSPPWPFYSRYRAFWRSSSKSSP